MTRNCRDEALWESGWHSRLKRCDRTPPWLWEGNVRAFLQRYACQRLSMVWTCKCPKIELCDPLGFPSSYCVPDSGTGELPVFCRISAAIWRNTYIPYVAQNAVRVQTRSIQREGSQQKRCKGAGSGEGPLHEEGIYWYHRGLLHRKRKRCVSLLGKGSVGRLPVPGARERAEPRKPSSCFGAATKSRTECQDRRASAEMKVRTGGWEIVHFVRPRTEVLMTVSDNANQLRKTR